MGELGALEHDLAAAGTHARRSRVLERHGRSLDGSDDAPDVLAQEQLALAMVYGASAGDRELLGDAPGQRTRKVVVPVRELAKPKSNEGIAQVGGVNIHAGAALDGRDRPRRSRLCRYVARPPISQKRLEVVADGRVKYGFRHAWRDGTCAVLLDPLDFLARLAAHIPPPNFHTLGYHGVLAAHAKDRARVVPGPAPESPEPSMVRQRGSSSSPAPGEVPDTRGPT